MRLLTEQPLTVETRSVGETSVETITGYASVFYQEDDPGTEFDLGNGFVERVMPGAFDAVLAKNPDVAGLWNHNRDMPLGRTRSGTLRLSVDSRGLRYEIDTPDTQAGRDSLVSIRRGDVRGSSIGFSVDDDGETRRLHKHKRIREIRSFASLLDVSPVTFPAFESTSTAIRSAEEKAWESVVQLGSEAERLRRLRELDLEQLGIEFRTLESTADRK